MIPAGDVFRSTHEWRNAVGIECLSCIADALEALATTNEKMLRRLEEPE